MAAFEPNPDSFSRLELHRKRNGFKHLLAYPAAASDHDGTLELLRYGQGDSTTTHFAFDGETLGAQTDPLKVPVVRLDTLVERGELRPPQLVKIDAEGHGHKVLLGARATITAHRPVILIGFHCSPEISGALAILSPLGYHAHTIDSDGRLIPLTTNEFAFGDYVFITTLSPQR